MDHFQQGFLKEAQAHGEDPVICWSFYKQAVENGEFTPMDYLQMVGGGAGLGGLATGLPTAGISAIHQLTQDKKKRDWSKPLQHGAIGAVPGAMLGGAGGLGLMGLTKVLGTVLGKGVEGIGNHMQARGNSTSQYEHLLASPEYTTPEAPWNDPVAAAQLKSAKP